LFAVSAGRIPVPAGWPRVDSVSPETPRFPVRSGPPVVLSGYVRDSDVSCFIAGATAPESGDFE
jgi:hypothetical protein